ncbi:MAG: hypothetical protein GY870_10545 [archaeon]|nr:hypothetical protein [archaeon]
MNSVPIPFLRKHFLVASPPYSNHPKGFQKSIPTAATGLLSEFSNS